MIYLQSLSVLLFCVILLPSCSSEALETEQCAEGGYVYEMYLDANLCSYSDASTRAAKVFQSSDVMYLRFSGGTVTNGTATYDGSKWTLTTDKALTGSGSCHAVQVDNAAGTVYNGVLPLNASSSVYESKDGQWSVSGKVLTVTASLKPLLGRFRFKGVSGTSFSVLGLSTLTGYNLNTGSFTQTQDAVSGTIGSSGYSTYIYGLMANSASPRLQTGGFSLVCPSTMLHEGQSGWLDYPTSSNHKGWTQDTPAGNYEYVDLGLSVNWATCNVGASSPEDYGDYYAWGETQTKSTYDWSTYLDSPNRDGKSFTNYYNNGGKTQLLPEDDVAHVKWKGTWRMPTRAEQDELREQCTWTWTSQGGKKGYKVTSKKNGNSIFLPAAGWRYDSDLNNAGSIGNYWSSSLNPYYDGSAYNLYFNSGYWGWDGYGRYSGLSVRAVCPNSNSSSISVSSITLNQTSLDLSTGSTYQLSATVSPSNATNKNVTWSSSNTDVATVSSAGLVTAKAAGSATITATAADGSGVKATCSVTVKNGNSFDKEDFGSDNNWN